MERVTLATKIDYRLRKRFDGHCYAEGITMSTALENILTRFFAEVDGPKALPKPTALLKSTEQVTEQVGLPNGILKAVQDRLLRLEGQVESLVTDQVVAGTRETAQTMDDLRLRLSRLEARPPDEEDETEEDSTMASLASIMYDERLKALEEYDFDAMYGELRANIETLMAATTATSDRTDALDRQLNNLDEGFKALAASVGDLQARMQRDAVSDERANTKIDAVIDRNFEALTAKVDALGKKLADIEAWITLEVELSEEQGIVAAPPPVETQVTASEPEPDVIDINMPVVEWPPRSETHDAGHAQAIAPALRKLPKSHDKTPNRVVLRSEGPAAFDPTLDEKPTGIRVAWSAKSLKHRMKVQTPRGKHTYTLIDNRDGTWTLQADNGGESLHANLPAKDMAKKLAEADMRPSFAAAMEHA